MAEEEQRGTASKNDMSKGHATAKSNKENKDFIRMMREMIKVFRDDIHQVLSSLPNKQDQHELFGQLHMNINTLNETSERILDTDQEISQEELEEFFKMNDSIIDVVNEIKESNEISQEEKESIESLETSLNSKLEDLVSINDEMKQEAEERKIQLGELKEKMKDNIKAISTSSPVEELGTALGRAVAGPFFDITKGILGVNSNIELLTKVVKLPFTAIKSIASFPRIAKEWLSTGKDHLKAFISESKVAKVSRFILFGWLKWILRKTSTMAKALKGIPQKMRKGFKDVTKKYITNPLMKLKDKGGGIFGMLFAPLFARFKGLAKLVKPLGTFFRTVPGLLKVTLLGGMAGVFAKVFGGVGEIIAKVKNAIVTLLSKLPIVGKLFQTGTKEVATKTGTKVLAKVGTKGALKTIAKKIPGLSILAGLGFGVQRAFSGDFVGAGGEVLSGLLGSIPGLGTAGSLGLDAALIARDIKRSQGEVIAADRDVKQVQSRSENARMVEGMSKSVQMITSESRKEFIQTQAPTRGAQQVPNMRDMPVVVEDMGLLIMNSGMA